MTRPVIVIGLDSADPVTLDEWIEAGHLPTLKKLRQTGSYWPLENFPYYRAEAPWQAFLTGVSPDKHGFWTEAQYTPEKYDIEMVTYDFEQYPPFYAFAGDKKVAIFDMPKTIMLDKMNGIQVLGWGGHAPATDSYSRPAALYNEIIEKYGENPALHNDHATIWKQDELEAVAANIKTGLQRRVEITKDLMQRDDWDLFLTIFGEPHSGGHIFLHSSDASHPLYDASHPNLMLDLFKAVDESLEQVLEAAPEDAIIIIMSVHGMIPNNLDIPSQLVATELMYRYSFPGEISMPKGKMGTAPPPAMTTHMRGFRGAAWSMKHDPNPLRGWLRRTIPMKYFSMLADKTIGDGPGPWYPQKFGELVYMVPYWWSPYWSQMKAFALPSFSEGYIRINLKGREANGIVEPAHYNATVDEIVDHIEQLTDARTGRRMAREVIRTRKGYDDPRPNRPDADIIVLWTEESVVDVADSPVFGRMGPFPFQRSGGHSNRGFALVVGPDMPAGVEFPKGHALDLPATILAAMGVAIPAHFEGKDLLQQTIGHDVSAD